MAGSTTAAAEAKQIIKQIKGLGRNLRKQKRLSAAVLKCGKSKTWLDPERKKEIALAQSRSDIRILVEKGLIKKKPSPENREVRLLRRFRLRMVIKATRDLEQQRASEGTTTITPIVQNEKEGPDISGEVRPKKTQTTTK